VFTRLNVSTEVGAAELGVPVLEFPGVDGLVDPP